VTIKKLLLILLVGFVLFWLFQDPSGLANSSEALFSGIWDLLQGFFEAVLDFVGAL
jgi:hypothetical protein